MITAPLYHAAGFDGLTRLTVEVACEGFDLIISLPQLAAINEALLKRRVTNLAAHEDEIRRALDRLFTGF